MRVGAGNWEHLGEVGGWARARKQPFWEVCCHRHGAGAKPERGFHGRDLRARLHVPELVRGCGGPTRGCPSLHGGRVCVKARRSLLCTGVSPAVAVPHRLSPRDRASLLTPGTLRAV